jgi:hypothetical protein
LICFSSERDIRAKATVNFLTGALFLPGLCGLAFCVDASAMTDTLHGLPELCSYETSDLTLYSYYHDTAVRPIQYLRVDWQYIELLFDCHSGFHGVLLVLLSIFCTFHMGKIQPKSVTVSKPSKQQCSTIAISFMPLAAVVAETGRHA